MRKRINPRCVCSSENYRGSRKAHLLSLRLNHEANEKHLKEITKDVVVEKHYTEVKVFGKWIKITGPIEKYKGFELR